MAFDETLAGRIRDAETGYQTIFLSSRIKD